MTGNTELANADLIYQLRGLSMGGTVLVVGSHPDDEETGLLAYLCRRMAVRVVYWSATRGEGGQNRAGPERGAAFGIIRSWESLAARQVDGGEVLYGPFNDFGFVKTAQAALSRWGEHDVVMEIVRAIRLVQPQVVIARWSGGPADGHGHHRAIGLATVDAFDIAADPDSCPQLDAALYPSWCPQKLYRSMAGDWQPGEDWVSGTRMAEYDRDGLLAINAGVFDPLAGSTYEELAAKGRNRHQSQGLAFLPERGDYFYYLALLRGRAPAHVPENGLFDGVNASLVGLAECPGGPPELRPLLELACHRATEAVAAYRPHQPEETGSLVLDYVAVLRQARQVATAESRPHIRQALLRYLDRKIAVGEQVAAPCLGISSQCVVDLRRVTPGHSVHVVTRLWSAAPLAAVAELRVPEGWRVRPADSEAAGATGRESGSARAEFDVTVPVSADLSCPYWLRRPPTPYRYTWPDQGLLSHAFDEPVISAAWQVEIGSHRFGVEAPAVKRETCVGGYRELPLQVVPPVALRPRQTREVLPAATEATRFEVQVAVESIQPGAADGTLTLAVPPGWDVHPRAVELNFRGGGGQQSATFEVIVPALSDDAVHRLDYDVFVGDHHYGVLLNAVRMGAPGVRAAVDETNCVAEALVVDRASVSVHVIDAAFVGTLRYGYIPGAEEGILASIFRFGLDMTVLVGDELAYVDLSRFDAIVVGPNAYVLGEGVRQNAARLLEYVEGGGTLIVQYQTYPYEEPGLAPYPFRFRRPHDRVTFPDAPVTLLDPDNPILQVPNKITEDDFDGWVHDRGLYFFGEYDPHYTALLACHDPGEPAQTGGLVVAAYGQGSYVYAGYSFFRQIPAAVPGSIRLFANLLGLAQTKVLERMERVRTIELLSSLSDPEAYEAARVMTERSWDDGAYLCRQGDRDSDLFLPLQGTIAVIKESGDRQSVIYQAAPGEAVGELALLADIPRSATLRAQGRVTALVMRGSDFRNLMEDHPEMSRRFVTVLARKLAGEAARA